MLWKKKEWERDGLSAQRMILAKNITLYLYLSVGLCVWRVIMVLWDVALCKIKRA